MNPCYRRIYQIDVPTNFFGIGVDSEELRALDLFLKNILYVAELQFSIAKHLHDVCGGQTWEIWLLEPI